MKEHKVNILPHFTRLTCESEDRELAGESREEARQLTEGRGPPHSVVDEVHAAVGDVHSSDDQQVEAHAQVTQR
ncbi:hypothetical protein E2C01_076011 [Portunus trituberculatus]|uniref:Uncharacterized protein n=1 Tax=Portunus trituberculatus TaxID=210409 RepID=A0A5B7IIM0_PORTR|nr:hypothetical protein [Portunus trituberculatus]